MQSRPRPLIVPDLSRPPGADIDAEGFVRCQSCGARVDVMAADVVGEGYQCGRCTAMAPSPDPDAGMPRASRIALAGAALLVVAAVLWVLRIGDVSAHVHSDEMPLPLIVGIAGVGCFGIAWGQWRR